MKIWFGLIGCFMLVFLLSNSIALSIDKSLYSGSESNTIHVIVTPSQPTGLLYVLGILSNANRKSSVASALSENYDVSYVGKTTNSISLEVTPEQLASLSTRNDISSIKIVPALSVQLQDSVPLIGASNVSPFQINGQNLTGSGESVCIIDTGVNYTHSALGACSQAQFLSGNCSKVIGGYAFYNLTNISNPNDIMDNNGHGTHVSGIVAASGGINGVSPGAKIVMMKACDSNGQCDSNAVIDSINWCVGNASKYNISVISMSLGGGSYQTHAQCDGNDAFTLAVAGAAAKGIPVVAAAGNDGSATNISYPACLSNVTAVAATTKSDYIDYSYSNRNSLVELLAPGTNINSTWINGGYAQETGTSMATPHVAGAIAIIKQLLSALGLNWDGNKIVSLLNSTGKRIIDNVTNISYSRINVESAVLSLDSIAPNITLLGLANNSTTSNTSISFSVYATDWSLANSTFSLSNTNGSVLNKSFFTITGLSNTSKINIENVSPGYYNWSFSVSDSSGNINISSRTFEVSALNVTLMSPSNEYNVTSNDVNLTFSFGINNSLNIINCTLNIGNASYFENVTNQTATQYINASVTPGTYSWYVKCFDNQSGASLSETRTLIINSQVQVSPPAASSSTTSSSGGGGSGGGNGGGVGASVPVIYTPLVSQLNNGYVQAYNKYQGAHFRVFDSTEDHKMTVTGISNDSANITIESSPMNLTLSIGEGKMLNLSSDKTFDLYVLLNNIKYGQAIITIKTISVNIYYVPASNAEQTQTNISANETNPEQKNAENHSYIKYIIISVVATAVLIFLAIYIYNKIKDRRKPKRKVAIRRKPSVVLKKRMKYEL